MRYPVGGCTRISAENRPVAGTNGKGNGGGQDLMARAAVKGEMIRTGTRCSKTIVRPVPAGIRPTEAEWRNREDPGIWRRSPREGE